MFLTLVLLTAPTFFTLAAAEQAYNESVKYDSGLMGDSPTQSYVAATDFTPVQLNYEVALTDEKAAKISSGLMFFATTPDAVQPGPLIIKQDGTVVWDGGAVFPQSTTSFMVEPYMGEDHMIVWSGQLSGVGYGWGSWHVLNTAYEEVATYTAIGLPNNTLADMHDSHIYSGDLATMTAYVTQEYDLSPYGGPKNGYILNCVVQEINITSSEVIFEWHSLDHVDPSESYTSPGLTGSDSSSPWDYFHLNAIDKDDSGNYLISGRHIHTLFYVDASSGDIQWRLGGKNSNFTISKDAEFSWQHDGRWRSASTISLFNNAGTIGQQDRVSSRGMLLNVDTTAMTVDLAQEYLPHKNAISRSQGNTQILENGNVIVGWGAEPYFGEYDSAGNLLWEMRFAYDNVQAYRAYRFDWTATPSTPPSLAVTGSDSNRTAYAWWNGATEVATWGLYGSSDSGESVNLANATRIDFETPITFEQLEDYTSYTVAALDASGQVLGTSDAVTA
ncbi:ASST-domain-containing protein [Schizophyllum amplum]|uniref:ASST-domain-containing protein n=1 Tax=Schizophyllum amplum TaxID=97359 RepID=A0A550BX48_9AGAR|nr:ASST-domain-containing protein [Auriculariopsis ampla]TRM57805.1 ASST-domain-containing protein [Auriculariopsis ampla]